VCQIPTEAMTEPMGKSTVVRRAVAAEAALAATALLIGRKRPLLAAGLAGAGALAARGAFARNSPLFGSVIDRGPDSTKRVALTFDDGPGPSTPAILDALAACSVRATFFVLGRQVETHPDTVRRIVDEGHELACHGYDHGILIFRDADHVADQIHRCEQAVADALGDADHLTRHFRAPHGFRGPFTAKAAARCGYRVIGWTAGVFDSAQPGADVIAQRSIDALAPGAILLLHDADGWDPSAHRDQTAQALPEICAAARDGGLEPTTLGAVLAA
jgi:peptidoglycan/xylan/chitin deacetylase (PgdA/CDA1 family)